MVYCYTEKKVRLLLRQIRLKRGLSQELVAEKLHVTKAYISQIELGKTCLPKPRMIIKFLEIYEIKPKYFEELLSKMD